MRSLRCSRYDIRKSLRGNKIIEAVSFKTRFLRLRRGMTEKKQLWKYNQITLSTELNWLPSWRSCILITAGMDWQTELILTVLKVILLLNPV